MDQASLFVERIIELVDQLQNFPLAYRKPHKTEK